ncbi:MAG: response regulator transcription factor [Bacteroidia bacterium]
MKSKKLKTLIVEDELPARKALKFELRTHCPEVDVISETGKVQEAIDLIEENEPDLVLLDIQLSDGSGLDVLKRVKRSDFHVVFTTAFSEFAMTAIKLSALDYLLKPIDGEELKNAIEKALDYPKKDAILKWDSLAHNLQNQENTRVAFQTMKGVHVFNIQEIIRFEADVNYVQLFTLDKKLILSKTLKEVDAMMSKQGFVRSHQSHLVNLSHVDQYNRTKNLLELKDGSTVPVSQRKRAFTLQALSNL